MNKIAVLGALFVSWLRVLCLLKVFGIQIVHLVHSLCSLVAHPAMLIHYCGLLGADGTYLEENC